MVGRTVDGGVSYTEQKAHERDAFVGPNGEVADVTSALKRIAQAHGAGGAVVPDDGDPGSLVRFIVVFQISAGRGFVFAGKDYAFVRVPRDTRRLILAGPENVAVADDTQNALSSDVQPQPARRGSQGGLHRVARDANQIPVNGLRGGKVPVVIVRSIESPLTMTRELRPLLADSALVAISKWAVG